MAKNYFHIILSVKPKGGGEAELVLPKVLKGLNYRFVIVKDGAEEGVIEIEEPADKMKKVEKDKKLAKLTNKQMEILIAGYPKPCIKKKFRFRVLDAEHGEPAGADQFELNQKGERIVDIFQTVRSGFYLIDVPVIAKIA